MASLGVAEQDAVPGGGEEIALDFKRGETGRGAGQSGQRAIAAGGIGERDERPRVQKAGGRQQLVADRQPCNYRLRVDLVKLDAEQTGQMLDRLRIRRRG